MYVVHNACARGRMQAPPTPAAKGVPHPEAAPGGPQQHTHNPSSARRQPRLTSQSTGRAGGQRKRRQPRAATRGATAADPRFAARNEWRRGSGVPGPMLAARARACAACLTYGPPCSFPPQCARAARRGELGTHPEAAPGEAPNLAPSARNGRLPWELWREKVRRI